MTIAILSRTGFVTSALAGLICLSSQPAFGAGAAESTVVSPFAAKDAAEAAAQSAAIQAYWTPERMAQAKPYPMPAAYAAPSQLSAAAISVPLGLPGAQPGFNPNDPNSNPKAAPVTFPASADTTRARSAAIAASASAAPASAGYPSAHTTQELQSAYRAWPRSTIGKLFFTQNAGDFVCSASLISYRHVVTAGHCVSDGLGNWSTNLSFCPSYDSSQGGVNPNVGYWTTNSAATTTRWFSFGEADADIGVLAYGNSGTLIANYPGSALGWLGYSWNWGIGNHEMMWGYPSAVRAATANNTYSYFQGGKIFLTAAEEAGYTVDWGTYADSKFIGTTQTPGMSGGPWIFKMGKYDYNSWNSNWVNGVNSHLRCFGPCTDNDWYQEVSSPQFIHTGDANGANCVGTCGVVDTILWAVNVWMP